MLKVFLVEDEYVIREGIKNNIDWYGNGFDFCGEASDGELAYPMIMNLRPDILITDIRMPFMDGLELSRLVKKELPDTSIIILSGFGDFNYAQDAIRIGVSEYLTKPINGDDLLTAVRKLAAEINERKVERELREKYLREMEENQLEERKKLFHNLVSGRYSMPELMSQANSLGIRLSAVCYNIVLLNVSSLCHATDEYSNSLIRATDAIEQFCKDHNIILFDRDLEGKALLLQANSETQLMMQRDDIIRKLSSLLNEHKNVRYFGGCGILVSRLSELPLSFESASKAYAHRFFGGDNTFMIGGSTVQSLPVEKEDFDLRQVDPLQIEKQRVLEFLKKGNGNETSYFVTEYLQSFGKRALESFLFRQYITMNTYFTVAAFVEQLGFSKETLDIIDLSGSELKDEKAANLYLIQMIEKAIDLRDSNSGNHYQEILDKATSYINSHYAEDDLSLNSLASYVNVSPNHLSAIFSQQIGDSFIRYLTNLRMDKAKELLRCTAMRKSEIAYEVGYKDAHYFSYIFKKTQGVTPTQFRAGEKAEDTE